jgi:hypothetical protein
MVGAGVELRSGITESGRGRIAFDRRVRSCRHAVFGCDIRMATSLTPSPPPNAFESTETFERNLIVCFKILRFTIPDLGSIIRRRGCVFQEPGLGSQVRMRTGFACLSRR